MANQSFKNLTVYKKAFELAMLIFKISKRFPKEERYSLTDQIRRSSRSVCTCIAEAYRKRHYEEENNDLNSRSEEIGRLVGHMIDFPEKYLNEKQRKAA